ncbi:hypothetical protein [Aquabacterium sp.]|uniref:hypothetical protein n=1 Tax=Aquabacterium sp. TaxID=1872578 RepID=UPI002C3C35B2|nr:hypothetical protein [Aquabacterium sp.]HSW06467.1 hypothetical protein [Aquabacterium sp.]
MTMMTKMRHLVLSGLLVAALDASAGSVVCPTAALPLQGAAVRGSTPVFPVDNWWNLDVRSAPVDANSAAFISFINNGGTRTLHPDFGGEESPGSVAIYGIPYAVVDGSQIKSAVSFQYADESDGVDPATGVGLPFYPIPTQSITQPHWVEGGAPANVDQRSSSDRHLLMVDCTNNQLYELYNVWYDASKGRWFGGSGAFFDMNGNARRPAGWTSADAAGLAIFPGLVRHDEVYNPALTEIGHALRVTVRATNGYVWPASHRAGSTAGALPMGARLRLKASVNGQDPALRSNDPQMQKIFRAMQRHGLIVADNGSDMYISGTFDTRWNNDILNPAFRLLSASDFEVIQLGWNPVGTAPALAGVGVQPASVVGGSGATGTVSLSAPAPAAGAVVSLASNQAAAVVPATVAVSAGASSATFAITTSVVGTLTSATITASWGGVSKTATLSIQPAAAPSLSTVTLAPTRVVGGQASTGTVTLSAAAPAGGAAVALRSSVTGVASVPANVLVPAGAKTASFAVSTVKVNRNQQVSISATWQSRTVSSALTVTRR